MKNVFAFPITVALIGCIACTQESAPARNKDAESKNHIRDWTPEDELPLLRADLITPQRDSKLFAIEPNRVKYLQNSGVSSPIHEVPFLTDDQAVAAAKKWITRNFGKLPEDVCLKATRVLHSSSGRPKPAFDWDIGHTITLRAYYRGIPTDNTTVIYITGRTKITGTIDLRRYTPLKTRGHIVDAEAAKRAWRKVIAPRKDAAEVLKHLDTKTKPRLLFVWSPKANSDVKLSYDVLAPTWVLDDEERIMVDGHSGNPWIND